MSGLNGRNRKDYSKYDDMSTESLEELLRLDADLPDGEESDVDEILYISEVIAKREREHPNDRCSKADVDAAWETFQTKYLPYVTDGRSLYDFDDDEPGNTKALAPDMPSPSGNKRISMRGRRFLGRMASIAAAIALLIGIMTATAYAMGFDLWGVIAQWTKDTFTFVAESNAGDEETTDPGAFKGEYADLQAALDVYGVTEKLAPTWIPDDFTLESVFVCENIANYSTVFWASYKFGEKEISIQINMYEEPPEEQYTAWQRDDIDVKEEEIGNCTFYIMQNAEQECAVWSVGSFECNISGDISRDELIKMLESIFL